MARPKSTRRPPRQKTHNVYPAAPRPMLTNACRPPAGTVLGSKSCFEITEEVSEGRNPMSTCAHNALVEEPALPCWAQVGREEHRVNSLTVPVGPSSGHHLSRPEPITALGLSWNDPSIGALDRRRQACPGDPLFLGRGRLSFQDVDAQAKLTYKLSRMFDHSSLRSLR